jgi:hypothetical protein
MNRLRAAPRPVRHPEHDHPALSIGEAGGILHRHLHVLLPALPGLEVEPLGFEIVCGRGLQAVQQGQEVVGRGNRHLFRIDPAGDGITRNRVSKGLSCFFSVRYQKWPRPGERVAIQGKKGAPASTGPRQRPDCQNLAGMGRGMRSGAWRR